MAISLHPTRVVTVRPLVFSKARQAAELLPAHRDHELMPAQLSDRIRRLFELATCESEWSFEDHRTSPQIRRRTEAARI